MVLLFWFSGRVYDDEGGVEVGRSGGHRLDGSVGF